MSLRTKCPDENSTLNGQSAYSKTSFKQLLSGCCLRIPDTYEAKIAKKKKKNSKFWTFWPLIQLIHCSFYIYGALAGLWARMSRSCRFLLFSSHKYQVSLREFCVVLFGQNLVRFRQVLNEI